MTAGQSAAPQQRRTAAAADAEAAAVDRRRQRLRRQSAIGLLLAAAVAGSWVGVQALALFAFDWSAGSAWLAPLLVAAVCWLDVGLFIVGHDAMHGSLAPAYRRANRIVGQLCLVLYAGFRFGRFVDRHFDHHRAPGTADDPDFNASGQRFWPWYLGFMRRYFGWREAVGLAAWYGLLVGVLGAPLSNVMVFWALPAVLSSVQLFAFGTWLPHRAGSAPFADRHRARSNAYGWLASLLSCFHFGYHHEHHLRPDAPWWRLPSVRRGLAAGEPKAAQPSRIGSAAPGA